MNTFFANKIGEKIGDRPTVTTNNSKYRENEIMLALFGIAPERYESKKSLCLPSLNQRTSSARL
jgi:hypothetical protein